MEIKVLTRPDCAYCPMVKKYLSYKGLMYKEETSWDSPSVPVTIFPNGKELVGYNIQKLAEQVNEITKQFEQDTMFV